MQKLRKVQVSSGKDEMYMDCRSIPNPKSLNVFIRKMESHYEIGDEQCMGKL